MRKVLLAGSLFLTALLWALPAGSAATSTQAWLAPYTSGKTLESIFTSVARKVRYEPYPGILRGPKITAMAGRGNDLDQSLLLQMLLNRRGYRTRLVEGTLNPDNARVLLRGAYPPELPKLSYPAEFAPYRSEEDEDLVDLVSRHFWVELQQPDGSWLPLDPSFPRAHIGEAYAVASRHYDYPPDTLYQRLRLRLLLEPQYRKEKVLFEIEKPVAALGFEPLLFSVTAIPLEKPAGEQAQQPGAAARVFGGALGGETGERERPEKDKTERLGTRYQWRLTGALEAAATHEVLKQDSGTQIQKSWLELTLMQPGLPERRIERVLFEADGHEDRPADYRRFLMLVIPSTVPPALVERQERILAGLPVEQWKKRLADESALAQEVLDIDARHVRTILETLLLRFASASDELTDRIAYNNALVPLRGTPRILFVSVQGRPDALQLALDLRLDEVEALPYPGTPRRLVRLFRMGRGIAESVGEARMLPADSGHGLVSTAVLIRAAREQGASLRVVDERSAADFARQAAMPGRVARLLEASLGEGWEAVVPERAVRLGGRDRWGWWRIHRDTGRVIGMMDNGLHAGMAEYQLASEKIGLNPNMGFAIGMVNGANSTLFTISGLLLRYGVTSEEMMKEVQAYLDHVLCMACPKVEAKAAASQSVTATGYCLKLESKQEYSKSAGVGFDFCDKYNDGFKCAAGMLISGLQGPKLEASTGVSLSYERGCRKREIKYEETGK